MDELLAFLQNYGWQLALIALAGIIILGVLKYCNVFNKLDEKVRHILYLIISVGLSVVGSIIYLACVHQLTVGGAFAIAGAILALNQTFYAIYANTPLKELGKKLVGWIKKLIISGKAQDVVDDVKEGELDSKDKVEELPTEEITQQTEDKKE